jgi:type I restriction enzyme S subunit
MSEQAARQPPNEYQRFLQTLPMDWDRKEIRQLGTVVGGGTPSRDVPSFWQGGIPWVTPGEVSGNATKFLYATNEHISATGLAGSGANVLPTGSLMVTTRATLGARVINAVPMATNQGFKSIVFKQIADSGFYLYLFEKVQPELVRRASGTTFLEISGAEFASIEVPSPPLDEKHLIIDILDTLTTTIHETEAIIAKLKAVKQGLLHDLLTRGIDANGELRSPQAEAPHLYKKSPLGWIPKDWDSKQLREIVAEDSPITYGVVQPGVEVEDGVPFIRGGDVFGGRILVEQLRTISHRVSNSYRRTQLRGGELLMSLVGYPGEVGIAPVALAGANIARQAALIRPADSGRTSYVMHYLSSADGKRQILGQSLGSAQQVVNLNDVRTVEIPQPPLDEAAEVAHRVGAVSDRLDQEFAELGKRRALKSGLMDDLLTGRVRVTPLLEGAA